MDDLTNNKTPGAPVTDEPGAAPVPPGAGRALKTRACLALGAVLVAFLLLACRLARLQVARGEEYERLAESQQILSRELSARRGGIFDCKGRLLATSVERWSIYADPKAVSEPDLTAGLLGRKLNVPRDVLAARLRRDSCFAWVKRQVTEAEAETVRKLNLPGVYLRKEHKRLYPQGALAAPVIGFTDVDGVGLAGLELGMDPLLRGRPGRESVLCDGGRRIIRAERDTVEQYPFNGYDVVLTLDAYVQSIAEDELREACERHAPERATAVVMDVWTGAVLAMASLPAFDPQSPTGQPTGNQRNMAICDCYEYGSAFKPVTVALALERGLVTPDTQLDCHEGAWRVGKRTVHDVHPYSLLSVSDVVCLSSNIGAAQIGTMLGCEAFHDGVREFGFGEPTGIALPGEIGGIVRPLRLWSNYSVVSVAFGQELAATALGMARAFAVFAAGGRLTQPRLIEVVRHAHTGEVIYSAGEPIVAGQPISSATAQQVMEMMRRVVSEGTGTRAKDPAYPLAGKTGTAQLLNEGGRGYSSGRYLSSFIAVGPVPGPRIVVLVTLKDPRKNGYYGGTVAAPVVRNIAVRTLRYMQVPPVAQEAPEGAVGKPQRGSRPQPQAA